MNLNRLDPHDVEYLNNNVHKDAVKDDLIDRIVSFVSSDDESWALLDDCWTAAVMLSEPLNIIGDDVEHALASIGTKRKEYFLKGMNGLPF